MYPSTVSLALKGAKSAYEAYADYRDKKAAELYDTMRRKAQQGDHEEGVGPRGHHP